MTKLTAISRPYLLVFGDFCLRKRLVCAMGVLYLRDAHFYLLFLF